LEGKFKDIKLREISFCDKRRINTGNNGGI